MSDEMPAFCVRTASQKRIAAWRPDLLSRAERSRPTAAKRRAGGAGLDGEMRAPSDRPCKRAACLHRTMSVESSTSFYNLARPKGSNACSVRQLIHRSISLEPSCIGSGYYWHSLPPRALGSKVTDEFTVPLCRIHHRDLHLRADEAAWWGSAQDRCSRGRTAVVGRDPWSNLTGRYAAHLTLSLAPSPRSTRSV
jgi:hypothetical protein